MTQESKIKNFIEMIKEGKVKTIEFDWKRFEEIKKQIYEKGRDEMKQEMIEIIKRLQEKGSNRISKIYYLNSEELLSELEGTK